MIPGGPVSISGVLVVHNEEKLVGPCLASMAPLCDELLVAHDGPCRDRSVEIAREHTQQIFVHEPRGAPEINLIKLLRRARHDWVLRLDCDETLSPELQRRLAAFKREPDPEVTQVRAIWRAIYANLDESPARWQEQAHRLVLFRKSCSRWIGLPHSSLEVEGPSLQIRECIYHYAPHQEYSAYQLLVRKVYPFSRTDAALRLMYPIEVFGYEGLPLVRILRPVDRWRVDHPLLLGSLLGVRSFLRAFGPVFRANNLREFRANLRWPVAHGAYQVFLGYHLRQLRRRGYRPRLARDEVAAVSVEDGADG